MDLRPSCRDNTYKTIRTTKRHHGVAPYGYISHLGQLHQEPREQANITLIVELKSKGLSLNGIAKEMNRRKRKNRSGGLWDHSLVRSILNRNNRLNRKDH
ncbi:MAG: recombinase family protein [Bdellovibrionaceae bacterium]|nr:recombinase family protein [Pseudobdellovibrionaceae bacterium]